MIGDVVTNGFLPNLAKKQEREKKKKKKGMKGLENRVLQFQKKVMKGKGIN